MRNSTEDGGATARRCASVVLVALSIFGCGSPVTVAEQKAKVDASDASKASDASEANDANVPDGVPCGDVNCSNRGIGNSPAVLYGCCFDAMRSACGVVEFPVFLTCTPLGVPGKIDSSCSAGPSISGIGPLPGCCHEDGTCGVMESTIGLGCTSIPFLPTQSCKYSSD